MKKNVQRILSLFLAVLMLPVAIVPAYAADNFGGGSFGGGAGRSDFFTWTDGFGGGSFGGGAGRHDSESAYDDYVTTLPAPGYNSDGHLKIIAPVTSVYVLRGSTDCVAGCSHYSGEKINWTLPFIFSYNESTHNTTLSPLSGNSVICSQNFGFNVYFSYRWTVPVSGFYTMNSKLGSGYLISKVGEKKDVSPVPLSTKAVFYEEGYEADNRLFCLGFVGNQYSFASFNPIPLVFDVVPVSALSGDTYNVNSRPTSITGGNYGIVGDNGQITKVEDNSTIVNETNNTFYNPATGTTVPITNWSYDYSDRSYKVTTESGDTVTITYGDENITIKEGDTVYNIYYLVDGSGSETPVDPPAPCEHTWTETSATPATCTIPGSASYICSKCQQTKTETLPALGHDWQVKQTVTTQYDDTGQLVQAGYTIFECSLCHEQYKSTDGAIPPGGGSGTDPGGEDKETVWDKLGKLLGTAVKGLLDLLGAAIDTVLGGLIDLITNLVESLKQLVDLFGSVGEAFQVLWTWLPPEVTAILVAGVSIFVFVALLKFFMK